MNLYSQKDSNIRKTWILMTIFFIVVIALGWFLSYEYQSPQILWIALFISLIMNFASYWFSDKIVLKISKAKELDKESNLEVYRIVENLSITAGLPMPKIYLLPEKGMNAFATGRDPKHGVIALTSGLIEKLDKTELEGVIAHELSHIANRDTLLQTVVVVLVGLIVIVSDIFLRSRLLGFRSSGDDNREGGQLGAIIAIVGLIFIIISPLIAKLIQLAISRKREFLADSSASLLTRYPEGLAKALEKISNDKNPMKFTSNAISHLYISNPKKEKKSRFAKFFMTHPPTEERIKALRS